MFLRLTHSLAVGKDFVRVQFPVAFNTTFFA